MQIKHIKDLLLGVSKENEKSASEPKQEVLLPFPLIPNEALIIVPIRSTVLLPQNVFPLLLDRKSSIAAVQQAVRSEKPIGLIMQLHDKDEDPEPKDLHKMGTIADILRYITAPDGSHHIVCQGLKRFRIKEFLPLNKKHWKRWRKVDKPQMN